jgi:hypothetical protein
MITVGLALGGEFGLCSTKLITKAIAALKFDPKLSAPGRCGAPAARITKRIPLFGRRSCSSATAVPRDLAAQRAIGGLISSGLSDRSFAARFSTRGTLNGATPGRDSSGA